MKRKLLSLLVLLMTAATGAWAQSLYLEVNGTAATLKYSDNGADYSDKPSFTGTSWNASGFRTSVKTITVDASCENFAGDKLEGLFSGCSELTSITGLGTINTTNVTTMRNMFQNCSGLGTLDLSGFNTSSVTNMSNMFYGCSGLTTLTFGSSFNTAKVTDMSYMFYNCSGLGTLDLSGFNTSSVTTMSNMFRGCAGLQTLDLSDLNTSSVKDMSNMFRGCAGLQTLDISSFNTGNDTKMGSMFNGCSQLTAIFVGAGWSVGSSATSMFTNCTNLPNWDGTTNGTKAYYGGDGKGYLTYKPAGAVILTAGAGDATNEYWATYYNSTQGFTADASTTVYQAAVNTGKTAVVLTPVTDNEIPAGQAVVLKSSTLAIMLTPATTTQTLDYNELRGSDVDMAPLDNAYCLTKGTQMGFYRYTGTIPANRAYMVIEGVPGADARGFYGFGEEETSIQAIDNGQLTIDNEVYDLQGRRVSQPTKGLYIVNGKKMVIK